MINGNSSSRQGTFNDYWDDIAGEGNRTSFADRTEFGEFASQAHDTPFNGEPVVHEEEAPDVGLSPEEAFGGVASVSDRIDESRDTPTERGAWADVTPERDEAQIADIARRDRMNERQQADRTTFQEQQLGRSSVGFERQNPSGRMAPENVQPDPDVPSDRDPDTGRFVSRDRSDAGIGRRGNDGRFIEW